MPYLPLGRLFWKFLIFFFLAQMTAVLGIGLAIWAIRAEQGAEPPPPDIDAWLAARPWTRQHPWLRETLIDFTLMAEPVAAPSSAPTTPESKK